MARPQNPLAVFAVWLGYWVNEYQPIALVISSASLAVGGAIFPPMKLAGLALILFGALIPSVALYAKRKGIALDETAAAREKLLEEGLQPLLERTASVVTMPREERKREADHEAEMVVQRLAAAFYTVPNVRTAVFTVSDDGQRLELLHSDGRPIRPGPYVRGTPRGDKAFQVLGGAEQYIWVRNLDTDHPAQWEGMGATYRTFIAAPIRSRGDGFGLLTVDAPVAGSLDKRLAATLSLFAATLGVLFAEAARTADGAGNL